jgi:hypothetical protein
MSAPLQVPDRDPNRAIAKLVEQVDALRRAKVDHFKKALEGRDLLGCPSEPPWQVERPSWARDATPAQLEKIRRWLAWFYGLPDVSNRPAAPLASTYCFRVVGPLLEIDVDSSVAELKSPPKATAEYSFIDACAERLAEWRREPCQVQYRLYGSSEESVSLTCWQRPEFVTLALSRTEPGKLPKRLLARSGRGDSDLAGQFGVIPLDIDIAGGLHAERSDGLRLPEPYEVDALLEVSQLPWGYQMRSAGGLYAYLKLSEPIVFEEDPIRAVEIIKGAQQRVVDEARNQGIHVDLAYTSATSLCRVPHTYQSKYLWRPSS